MAYALREAAKSAAGLVLILGWVTATLTPVITAQLMTVDEKWEGWDVGLGLIFILAWLALSAVVALGLWLILRRWSGSWADSSGQYVPLLMGFMSPDSEP